MIVVMIRTQHLDRTMSLSHPLTMPKMQLTLPPLAVPMTDLVIDFALITAMMPACHVPVTNVASAKTQQLNGPIVPCIILPLVH